MTSGLTATYRLLFQLVFDALVPKWCPDFTHRYKEVQENITNYKIAHHFIGVL